MIESPEFQYLDMDTVHPLEVSNIGESGTEQAAIRKSIREELRYDSHLGGNFTTNKNSVTVIRKEDFSPEGLVKINGRTAVWVLENNRFHGLSPESTKTTIKRIKEAGVHTISENIHALSGSHTIELYWLDEVEELLPLGLDANAEICINGRVAINILGKLVKQGFTYEIANQILEWMVKKIPTHAIVEGRKIVDRGGPKTAYWEEFTENVWPQKIDANGKVKLDKKTAIDVRVVLKKRGFGETIIRRVLKKIEEEDIQPINKERTHNAKFQLRVTHWENEVERILPTKVQEDGNVIGHDDVVDVPTLMKAEGFALPAIRKVKKRITDECIQSENLTVYDAGNQVVPVYKINKVQHLIPQRLDPNWKKDIKGRTAIAVAKTLREAKFSTNERQRTRETLRNAGIQPIQDIDFFVGKRSTSAVYWEDEVALFLPYRRNSTGKYTIGGSVFLEMANAIEVAGLPKERKTELVEAIRRLQPAPVRILSGSNIITVYEEQKVLNVAHSLQRNQRDEEIQKRATKPAHSKVKPEQKGGNPKSERKRPQRARASRETNRKGTVDAYLHDIGRHPLLTRKEEFELAIQMKEGPMEERDEARQKFINANLRLVVSRTKRYANKGIALIDLIQEGNLGLIRAVKKFRPRRGYKFSTYATKWIDAFMQRAIENQSRTVKVPVHKWEEYWRYQRISKELENQGIKSTPEAIAEKAGVDAKRVRQIKEYMQSHIELDAPIGEENETRRVDILSDDNEPYNQARREARQDIERLLQEIGKRTSQDASETISEDQPIQSRELEIARQRTLKPEGEKTEIQSLTRQLSISKDVLRRVEKGIMAKVMRIAQEQMAA